MSAATGRRGALAGRDRRRCGAPYRNTFALQGPRGVAHDDRVGGAAEDGVAE